VLGVVVVVVVVGGEVVVVVAAAVDDTFADVANTDFAVVVVVDGVGARGTVTEVVDPGSAVED